MMKTNPINHIPASFRDPSGFMFIKGDELLRQVNQVYQVNYDLLLSSGLYQKLVEKKIIIEHQEINLEPPQPETAYKIIKPEKVDVISYPYEWSFSQLKDAALCTLAIQKMAIGLGMSLKDASAYNIQFHKGNPLLIDTLSFEKYEEGKPWIAYRQFCQHFLAPLALMAKVDIRFNKLLRIHIDGIPLDLCDRVLPLSTRFNIGLFTHIHLHARAQERYSDKQIPVRTSHRTFSKMAMLGLIENLESTIRKLHWQPQGTEWADYYQIINYSDSSFETKKELVAQFIKKINPQKILDLGANNGVFSRLANETPGCLVISTDIDPAAVEINYLQCKKENAANILPLVIDLTNPSPSIGWHNKERASFIERGQVDLVMALALVHHLAISNNVPLNDIAAIFAGLGQYAIVEFVPKEDSQVQRLLRSRLDIFPSYTLDGFIEAFSQAFEILERTNIEGTQRVLFLLKKKAG